MTPKFKVGDEVYVTVAYEGPLYSLSIGNLGVIVQINTNKHFDYWVKFYKYPKERLEMSNHELRLATPLDKLL